MSKNALILCVDDEPVNLTIMQELLQDSYELVTVSSGESCLQQVSIAKPDLILLDVNMPDMDGLETCKRLRIDSESVEIPIIFVSALATHEELMAGYEAGGDDYITKPFSEDILQKKVQIALASQLRKQELKNISEQAVEALKKTLTNSEELGMVVRFLHQCRAAHKLDDLARNVFDCLREFELDGSLLILAEPENRLWFSDDIVRPMEAQILESLRGQDRVLSFGTRLAINSDFVSLLVRNLPSGSEQMARLRELLTIMIEGLDARLYAMQSEMLQNQRRDVLLGAMESTRENLDNLTIRHKQQKENALGIIAQLEVEFEKSLSGLDLTKQQKAVLMNVIESAAANFQSVYDDGINLDEQFDGIIEQLSAVL
ncbi:MAG: response regulator [Gammaproteobacteria bacterium]|nr:response regulator [Gammaproteobacteria bacterium]